MKNFKTLIDCAKITLGDFEVRAGAYEPRAGKDKLLAAANAAQVFVFKDFNDLGEFVHDHTKQALSFSSPFSSFSAEPLEGCFTYTILHPKEQHSFTLKISCILVEEYEPDKYMVYVYAPEALGMKISASNGVYHKAVCALLERMNSALIGSESVKEHVKMKIRGEKIVKTIRKITYVRAKKSDSFKSPVTGRDIDWSHRWFVRGHWRKCDSLGKNRAGEYCVKGHTWVSEHVKGPEHLETVSKVHLVR